MRKSADLLAGLDMIEFEAERQGAMSASRDESVARNPHRRGTALWHAWDRGWQKEFCKPQPHTFTDDAIDS